MTHRRKPRKAADELLPDQMRKFAEHFAVHADRMAALEHAYPGTVQWSSGAKHARVSRLLRDPRIAEVVAEIRKPSLAAAQMTFDDVLREAEELYWNLKGNEALRAEKPIGVMRELRNQLAFLVQLHAIAWKASSDSPLQEASGNVIQVGGQKISLDDVSDDNLRAAYAVLAGDVAGHAAGDGQALPGRFRELCERVPAGDPPQDALRGAAGRGGGDDAPCDGVHAAGRGEVDVLERVRARMGGRENPRDCPDCGVAHNGACP